MITEGIVIALLSICSMAIGHLDRKLWDIDERLDRIEAHFRIEAERRTARSWLPFFNRRRAKKKY
jgi:hypothetical protein